MRAALWWLACLCCAQAQAQAQAQPTLRELPPALLEAAPTLRPAGHGSFRWFGLLIYDAALWMQPADTGSPGAPRAQPGVTVRDTSTPARDTWTPARAVALRLHYARPLRGEDIAQRSIDEIARLGMGDAAQRTRWLARMREIFPDVQAGSVITGLHLPGRGARFFSAGAALGDIPDEAFSRAFFSIWLDPRSSAPALRAALLGERTP